MNPKISQFFKFVSYNFTEMPSSERGIGFAVHSNLNFETCFQSSALDLKIYFFNSIVKSQIFNRKILRGPDGQFRAIKGSCQIKIRMIICNYILPFVDLKINIIIYSDTF